MQVFNRLANKLGYIKTSDMKLLKTNIAKRLDEHRELVESIQENTDLFDQSFNHVRVMSLHDDYLMKLYYSLHGN